MVNEKLIEKEAYLEKLKSPNELIKDVIREANTLPKFNETASEKENLDIIKHLIKRLAMHQISLEEEASQTNSKLLWLTIITTIATIISSINIVKNLFK